ncbi:MAG: dinitrogenase iron-molybdenum cofactor biosynthesis protein [Candidatus Latescibacteria bacterium]|nr:dinitrogenase iron-molybdenum cofactor biosynthesis protein [Candidatus Latescibacterota bacterium]NIO55265.1 dinitrogenase iron-molybdenum cofactor biosynthesis protein [Candidatus Latescibacterota bacterium]
MAHKVLITIQENHIAPRFDLTTEVVMATLGDGGDMENQRTVVLPHASPEDLCHLILSEGVGTVICNGIEEEYYQYLTWKKIAVMDFVMGPWARALEQHQRGELQPGAILFESQERTPNV